MWPQGTDYQIPPGRDDQSQGGVHNVSNANTWETIIYPLTFPESVFCGFANIGQGSRVSNYSAATSDNKNKGLVHSVISPAGVDWVVFGK